MGKNRIKKIGKPENIKTFLENLVMGDQILISEHSNVSEKNCHCMTFEKKEGSKYVFVQKYNHYIDKNQNLGEEHNWKKIPGIRDWEIEPDKETVFKGDFGQLLMVMPCKQFRFYTPKEDGEIYKSKLNLIKRGKLN